MASDPRLPTESKSQRIGHMAARTLENCAPLSWRTTSLDGDEDVGLDYQVQVVETDSANDEGQYVAVFRLQLKGTKSTGSWSADKTFISVQLKGSTARYYARIREPILLVVCDLHADPDPRKCPAYFAWIHDEIKRRTRQNPSSIDENDYLSFRVPADQQLTPEFDALPAVERMGKITGLGLNLEAEVERRFPGMDSSDTSIYSEKVVCGLTGGRTELLDTLADRPDELWPEAPSDSLPWKLTQAKREIGEGRTTDAQDILATVDIERADDAEIAEYNHLNGLLLRQSGADLEAIDCFRKAYETKGRSAYLAAWVETEFCSDIKRRGGSDKDGLLSKLQQTNTDEVVALRARILAAHGDIDGANSEAENLPILERSSTKALIALTASSWQEVLSACDQGLNSTEPKPRGSKKALLHLLKARGLFHLAMGGRLEETSIVPPFGFPDMDFDLLSDCWEELTECINWFSKRGWQENTEFICDIWATLTTIFGLEQEQLPLLRAAAATRPHIESVQLALEHVAVQCRDFETALFANSRQAESPEALTKRACLLYQAGRYSECIGHLKQKFDQLDKRHPLFESALEFGILSADRMMRPEVAEEFERELCELPDPNATLASLKYSRSKLVGGLPSADDLNALKDAYSASKSVGLGLEYVMALDVNKSESAEAAVSVAGAVQEHVLLPRETMLHLAQAFTTLEAWRDLLNLGREGQKRFRDSARFAAIECFALDNLGLAAEAQRKLHELIEQGEKDDLAIRIYVQIASKTGFLDRAILGVEKLLEVEVGAEKKLGSLRLLYSLVNELQPGSQRAAQIAWSIGQIVDQEDEIQEGSFLAMFTLATTSAAVEVPNENAVEFKRRVGQFCERFPTSPVFSRLTLPEHPTLEDLEAMLLRIDPEFAGRRRQKQELEKRLELGELPVLFVWRPRNVFENITDAPSLWEVSKASKARERKFHLTMADSNWGAADTRQIRDQVPVLDLLALLVINDLDLFALLFDLYERVAIPPVVFEALRKGAAPFTSGRGRFSCERIIAALQANLDQIVLVSSQGQNESDNKDLGIRMVEEIRSLVRQDGFLLYSDDLLMRTYCCGDDRRRMSICTLDLLGWADVAGKIQPGEVAELISKLCEWNVGVSIQNRYLFAGVPSAVKSAANVTDAIRAIGDGSTSGKILDSVCNVDRPYKELHGVGVNLAMAMLPEQRNDLRSVSALLGYWFFKVRFHGGLGTMEPLKQLALLLANVAVRLEQDQQTAKRIWDVYLGLVEYEHGRFMDEDKEKLAIELFGRTVADLDYGASKQEGFSEDRRVNPKIAAGLTVGTADSECYERAYTNRWAQLLADDAKND